MPFLRNIACALQYVYRISAIFGMHPPPSTPYLAALTANRSFSSPLLRLPCRERPGYPFSKNEQLCHFGTWDIFTLRPFEAPPSPVRALLQPPSPSLATRALCLLCPPPLTGGGIQMRPQVDGGAPHPSPFPGSARILLLLGLMKGERARSGCGLRLRSHI